MPKITKRFIDAMSPDPEREVSFMDDALTGFGVRVKPTGAASYFVRYKGGRRRRAADGGGQGRRPDA